MKIKSYIAAHKLPVIVGAVATCFVLVAGGIWLYQSRNNFFKDTSTTSGSEVSNTDTTTQDNVNDKENTSSSSAGSTPGSSASTATVPTLEDVSINATVNVDNADTADLALYGPAATYRVDKLVNGSWKTIQAGFDYSGRGGYNFDTVSSADAVSHYKVYKMSGGEVLAASGDTSVVWDQIKSSGTISVPLAR